jgi:glutamate synthase domain-containing protein 2
MTGEWLSTLLEMQSAGVTIFHLLSDHHGRSGDGRFLIETLKEAHMALVERGVRDEVTLLGSGGIAGADNLPKGIISGLDAVGLDHVLLVAMQARLSGDMQSRDTVTVQLPKKLDEAWAVQRLVNLSCSWRDQMLEILGAMGVREVRRLRGEFGRSMMCSELEAEAFGEIEGFPGGGR